MGFSEYPESDVLEIQFGIVRVFSVQGLNFHPNSSKTISDVVKFGENCTVVVSNSLNEGCRLLTGEAFVDEGEEGWIEKKKTRPPFVLIYFKEFCTRTLKGGRRKEHEGCIITYDAFPEGKQDIRKWEKESLPNVVTSLVAHLSTLERPVNLVPVERAISGTTSEGVTLFDIKMTGSANVVVSSGKRPEDINNALLSSAEVFGQLEYKASRHFYSALNEKDRLKQFLSYFLFIERTTHKCFKSLDYKANARPIFNISSRLDISGSHFFEQRFSDSKNLAQRFNWCALLAWKTLNDSDIVDFNELKKTRDLLSHGEDIAESDLPVEKARKLASKILGTV
jgi:hypothetical protein